MSRHIPVTSVRAGNKCSGTIYALSVSGNVYRAKAYVPTDDAEVICNQLMKRATIQLKHWVKVKSALNQEAEYITQRFCPHQQRWEDIDYTKSLQSAIDQNEMLAEDQHRIRIAKVVHTFPMEG